MSPIHHPSRTKKRVSERLRFATYRIKCYLWIENKEARAVEGFGFAADVSETGVGMYTDAKIPKGTFVRMALESEDSTSYRGYVAWCQRYALEQRFHGHESLDHRLGVSFLFESEAERQRYLMYFNDLRKRATFLNGDFKF